MNPTEPRRLLQVEDLYRYEWLESVVMSPNGHHIATLVRRIAIDRNGYQADALLMNRDGSARVTLSEGEGIASSLAWSRDGKQLAFVWRSAVDDSWSLVVIDVGGPTPLLTMRHRDDGAAPSALDWSPDHQRIACIRLTPNTPSGFANLPLMPHSTRTITRLRYKQDGVGWVHDRYRQAWVLDVNSGRWSAWTHAELDHGEPRWSWSGDRIACTATAREQNESLGYGQLIIVSEGGSDSGPLPTNWPGLAAAPMWRQDDQALLFVGHDYPPPVHRRRFAHVWLLDLKSGNARNLSGAIDAQVGNYAVSDMRPGLTSVNAAWPNGCGRIYYLSTERGAVGLRSVDPETAEPTSLVDGHGVVFAFSVANDGSIAYGWSDPAIVGNLYLLEGLRAPRTLLRLNSWLRSVDIATPEELNIPVAADPTDLKSRDTVVHGWELRPPAAAGEWPYPAVAYVHCSMFSWAFSHEFQCIAASGFWVQLLNQVGTTAGYGQTHALGNYIGSQHRETREIHACVDVLAARPYVDPARIGVTGGSCGGYLTNWLIGHSERFAAAVTQRSISNLVSKFGTGDNGPEQATSEGASPPWLDVQLLWENSPIAYAPRVTTPLLIVHSSEDHRCPLSQAEEWFRALRLHGVPVELVVFEGESHELSTAGKPLHRIERINRIIGWFTRHMSPQRSGHATHHFAPRPSSWAL